MDKGEQAETEAHLRRQIEAYHDAALVFTAVTLGLPERLGAGPVAAEELAGELALSAPHLRRFLRGLVVLRVCEELPDGRFVLTEAGCSLLPGSPSRLREKAMIVVGQYWAPWAALTSTLRNGMPAFDTVFDMRVAEWRREHADQGALFEAYFSGEAFTHAAPILEMLDLANARTVAEIGGGHGGLLAAILLAKPRLTGVLIDAPHKLAGARVYLQSQGLAGRVGLVGGDATMEIHAEADLYVMKGVLQQFEDEEAGKILANCREAMGTAATLVIIERLLPERAADDPAAIILDLHMMAITGGRVRSRAEIEALLSKAGLAPAKVSLSSTGLSVLEATRA